MTSFQGKSYAPFFKVIFFLFAAVAISEAGDIGWSRYCSDCKAGFLKWKTCLTDEVKGLILEYGQQCIDSDPRLSKCDLDGDDDSSEEHDWPPKKTTRAPTTKKPTTTKAKPTTTTRKPTTKKSGHRGKRSFGNGLRSGSYNFGSRSFSRSVFKSGFFGCKRDVTKNNGFRFYFGGDKIQHDEFYKCTKGCAGPFKTCFNREVGNGDFDPEKEIAAAQSTSTAGRRKRSGHSYDRRGDWSSDDNHYHTSASWCHDKSLSGRIPYSDDDYESREIFDNLCGSDRVASALLLKCVITKAYPANDLNPILSVCRALKASNCSKFYDEIPQDCKNRANLHRKAYCKCKPPTISHFNTSKDCDKVRKYYNKNFINDYRTEKYFALIDDAIAGYIDLPFHPFFGFCNKSLEDICKEIDTPPPCTPAPTQAPTGGFSNAGRAFYQVFNPQRVETGIVHYFILSTDAASCTVTIQFTSPSGINTIPVALTNQAAVVQQVNVASGVGVLLTAECDFVVYGLNYNNNTADGWLGYPVEALASEYVVLGIERNLDEPAQLTIVAVEDNTECQSTFPNGNSKQSSLSALGVDLITSDEDLTGTIVKCNANVSVFSGMQTATFPGGCVAGDHVVEQLPPKSTLGKEFALVPYSHKCLLNKKPTCCWANTTQLCDACYDIFRVLAVDNDTQISYNGTQTNGSFTLQAGQSRYVTILVSEQAYLTSSKPILLGSYLQSQNYIGVTQDPSFSIIPHMGSFANGYRGATCFPQFPRHFVNLVIPEGTSSQLFKDGAPFLNASAALPIPGSGYEAFKYEFSCTGTVISFSLQHQSNVGFGLLAYGIGPAVSYAYVGGMKLTPTTPPGSGC